jgi:hypothetical protein
MSANAPDCVSRELATEVARNSDTRSAKTGYGEYWAACIFSYLGIITAGGIYGILSETIVGGNEPIVCFVVGLIIAGVCSVPVAITIALLAWSFCLFRFQATLATLIGGFTGILSSTPIALAYPNTNPVVLVVLAGCLGGCGGGLAAVAYWRVAGRAPSFARECNLPDWQFSLRDLFWRFTVSAMLVFAWSLFFHWVFDR